MLPSSARHVLRTIFNYPESRPHLRPTAWLDGLRGVAAFEVMLYHYHLRFLYYDHNPAYGSREDTKQWWRLPYIRNFYHSGHAMVNVFFLISGFVLTQRALTLIRTQNLDKLYPSISSAIFRRAIRLYLPCIIVTFFGMFLTYFGMKENPEVKEHFYLQIIDWAAACGNFVQPFHNYEREWEIVHKYEASMWTLPLELYGSVVCYLTVLAVARITHTVKRTAIVLVLTWFAAVQANWWSLNFLLGMLFADFMIWQGKTEKSWSTGFTAKCFWGVVFTWALYVAGLPDSRYSPSIAEGEQYDLPGFDWYYQHVPESWKEVESGGRFWWMISGITMTVSISQLPLLRRVFETRFCQYLGRISFMLYLVHNYVFEGFGQYYKSWLTGIVDHEEVLVETSSKTIRFAKGNSLLFVYICFWPVMLPVLLAIAGQVTKYVDDPSITFSKWLEGKVIEDDKYEYELAPTTPM